MSEEEIRLDQTKKVFDTIATLIKKNETCSYRYLIYDLLGFKGKDYATLLSGMTITNKLVECETQKEVLDKIKKYCENKIEEQKCMPDFSKSYLENYDKVMEEQHLSHSGVMLETIKSTTTKRCEEILKLLEEIE